MELSRPSRNRSARAWPAARGKCCTAHSGTPSRSRRPAPRRPFPETARRRHPGPGGSDSCPPGSGPLSPSRKSDGPPPLPHPAEPSEAGAPGCLGPGPWKRTGRLNSSPGCPTAPFSAGSASSPAHLPSSSPGPGKIPRQSLSSRSHSIPESGSRWFYPAGTGGGVRRLLFRSWQPSIPRSLRCGK